MSKTVTGTATSFLYDGANTVQELSGTTPTANLVTGLRVDETFTRTDSAGTRNFLADALGSSLALADSAGAIQTQYTYEPFGTTTVSGPASNNSFQYAGRENDGTGVYFYRARYYSPKFQRFISEDPVGIYGGINLYAYVGNGPTNFSDPYGLKPKPWPGPGYPGLPSGPTPTGPGSPGWPPGSNPSPLPGWIPNFPRGMNPFAKYLQGTGRDPLPTPPPALQEPTGTPSPNVPPDLQPQDPFAKELMRDMGRWLSLFGQAIGAGTGVFLPVVLDPSVIMPGYGQPMPDPNA